MSLTKNHILIGLSVICVLLCIELISYFAIYFIKDKGIFYNPVANPHYNIYSSHRESLLGWPHPVKTGNNEPEKIAGRTTPSFPYATNKTNCISLYGDSFTFSSGVSDEYAWGNLLSEYVNCRVATYGVGGYGSDQAYLRFRQNIKDKPRVVFLNHLSENILRNVNRFRDYIYPGIGLGFKPRFIVNDNESVDLLPMPEFNQSTYNDFILNPSAYLSHEYFIPGGSSGVSRSAFPYTFSVIRAFKHFHVKAKLRGEPRHLAFYQKNHPSSGLKVTTALLALFYREAEQRNSIPVVTIIPTGSDLKYFEERGVWSYQSLVDELTHREIPVLNFGEGIIAHLGNKDPCLLFDDCSGHYNKAGYALLAKIAYEYLLARDLPGNLEKH